MDGEKIKRFDGEKLMVCLSLKEIGMSVYGVFYGSWALYKDVWDAHLDIGEALDCTREPGNQSDMLAVAVKKGDLIIIDMCQDP